jgi:hypothetical protein
MFSKMQKNFHVKTARNKRKYRHCTGTGTSTDSASACRTRLSMKSHNNSQLHASSTALYPNSFTMTTNTTSKNGRKTTIMEDDTQSSTYTVEIVGLELVAELEESLMERMDAMSFSDGSSVGSYANDSLKLARVTAGARRRRTQERTLTRRRPRSCSDSSCYARDSLELTKGFRWEETNNKDRLPTEMMIFAPLKSEASPSPTKKQSKGDFASSSTHLGAQDLTKLKHHSLTNCAA